MPRCSISFSVPTCPGSALGRIAYRASTSTTAVCLSARVLRPAERSRSWRCNSIPPGSKHRAPPSISFRLPGAEGWVRSAPPIGSPGFPVAPQDDVPALNVPGFNVDEDGVGQKETTWSAQMPRPSLEELTEPVPPQFPDWLNTLGTMELQLLAALDPLIDRRIEINSLPRAAAAEPRSPSNVPQQPVDTLVPFLAPTRQNINPQPLNEKASWRTGPQLPTDGSVYAQSARLQGPLNTDVTQQRPTIPSMPAVRPVAELRLHPCEGPCFWRSAGSATGGIAGISAEATVSATSCNGRGQSVR